MCDWERFEGLSEEERDALLTKDLKVEVSRGYGHGWSSVSMTLDGMTCWHRVSYIGRSTGEFIYRVFFLGPNEELHFTFAQEGVPATWYLQRHDDLVYVKTPFDEHGFYLRWTDFLSQITEGWVSNGRLRSFAYSYPSAPYDDTPWWRDAYDGPINTRRRYGPTVDLAQIDATTLTDGYCMFNGYEDEVEIDLAPLAAARLHEAYAMFRGCRSLRSVDLSLIDTSLIGSMGRMFEGCSALEGIDFGQLDFLSTQNLCRTFRGCTSLSTVDLSGRQAPQARTMRSMFESSGIRMASLRDLRIPCVKRLDELFMDCRDLWRADLRGMRAESATMLRRVFRNCRSLTMVLVEGACLPNALDATRMLDGCVALEGVDFGELMAPQLDSVDYLFYACSGLERVRLAGLGGSRPRSLRGMFERCTSLEKVDFASIDLSRAQTLRDLFAECLSLERVDLSGCDLSSVVNMRGMFRGCSSLCEADLRCSGTGSLMTMRDLFDGCSSLQRVGLAGLDVRRVVTTHNLFRGCAALAEVDLTGWDAASLERADGMFEGCTGLRRWKVSSTWPVDLAGAVPEPANERGLWWSEREGGWLSAAQIQARGPMDDTYTLEEPRESSAKEYREGVELRRETRLSESGEEVESSREAVLIESGEEVESSREAVLIESGEGVELRREAGLSESELYRELGKLTKDRNRWAESIPYVSSLFAHESVKIQAKALWLLGEMGLAYPILVRDVVPTIASFLNSPVPLLRERAVNALGRIGRSDFHAIQAYWSDLFRLATDEDARVRMSFIWASENIATNTPDIYGDHMSVFERLLRDRDDKVRMEAPEIFRVLGKRRPEFVKPYLQRLRDKAMYDSNRVVRIHSLAAIKAAGCSNVMGRGESDYALSAE